MQNCSKNAPVILWLQGGPGASSLYGIFNEIGPFSVTENRTLKDREYSWHVNHNIIYIDNPVGTGYSFTDNDLGYVTNETEIGRDLYAGVIQFFKLFPEFQKNEFYVVGESYAGKFVPAVSYTIKNNNVKANIKVNLNGIAIGSGWVDPINQIDYSEYFYQHGLVDFNARDKFKELENEAKHLIRQGKYAEAQQVLGRILGGTVNERSLFQNLTGYTSYFNYLYPNNPKGEIWFIDWAQKPDVRYALHVGNRSFSGDVLKVVKGLANYGPKSIAPILADLMQHYRVLIYNGQMDLVCPYPMMENSLQNLKWPGAKDYKNAERKQWWVGEELAGFTKSARNLTEILVRNAGHIVPGDQPKWLWNMITHFTYHKSF